MDSILEDFICFLFPDSDSRAVGDAMPKWWIRKVPVDGAEEHAARSRVLIVAPSMRLLVLKHTQLKKKALWIFNLLE